MDFVMDQYDQNALSEELVLVTPELNFWWADADKRDRNAVRKRIRFWELVVVTEGTARLTMEQASLELKRNDYILLSPASASHRLEGSPEWTSIVISFEDSSQRINSPVACAPRPNREIRLPRTGTIEGNPVVLELTNRLCACWQKQNITREQAGVITESLLLLLTNHPVNPESELQRPLAELVRTYLIDNWNKDWYVEDIAREMGCSAGYLARMFRKSYNMTMRQMQMQLRIEKACLYMLSGSALHDVAYSCGFHDYYHFLRVFKEVTGMTTGEYLRKKAL